MHYIWIQNPGGNVPLNMGESFNANEPCPACANSVGPVEWSEFLRALNDIVKTYKNCPPWVIPGIGSSVTLAVILVYFLESAANFLGFALVFMVVGACFYFSKLVRENNKVDELIRMECTSRAQRWSSHGVSIECVVLPPNS